MEETLDNKLFTCPGCGPVEICLIHGEWANKNLYMDMVFEITRPNFEIFNAKISERSSKYPDGLAQPCILADIETYAEENRKFQCSRCGKVFVIPKRIHADPAAVTAGPAVLGNPPQPGMNPFLVPTTWPNPPNIMINQVLERLFDTHFTETELDTILIELGDLAAYTSKAEKLHRIIAGLS